MIIIKWRQNNFKVSACYVLVRKNFCLGTYNMIFLRTQKIFVKAVSSTFYFALYYSIIVCLWNDWRNIDELKLAVIQSSVNWNILKLSGSAHFLVHHTLWMFIWSLTYQAESLQRLSLWSYKKKNEARRLHKWFHHDMVS